MSVALDAHPQGPWAQTTAGKKTKTLDRRNFAKIFMSYSSFVLSPSPSPARSCLCRASRALSSKIAVAVTSKIAEAFCHFTSVMDMTFRGCATSRKPAFYA
jgi:hypothetical protein